MHACLGSCDLRTTNSCILPVSFHLRNVWRKCQDFEGIVILWSKNTNRSDWWTEVRSTSLLPVVSIYEVAMFLTIVSSNNMTLHRLSHYWDLFWLLQYLYPPAPLTWAVPWAPSTAHVMWMRHASGALPREIAAAHPSVTLAAPGRSRERFWLVTWTAQGRSHDLGRCYTCQMFNSHFRVVYCQPVSEKSLCAQSKRWYVRRRLLLSFLLISVF